MTNTCKPTVLLVDGYSLIFRGFHALPLLTAEGGEYTKYMDFGNWEHAFLNVDGAYMCSKVYLNDQFLYMHPHGYTPYLVDLTDKMWKNTCNRITIITQNLQPSTRWYTGAGLYRDVFLWVGGKVRMEPWDVFVTTKSADEKKAIMSASVTVTSENGRVSDAEAMIGNVPNSIHITNNTANILFFTRSHSFHFRVILPVYGHLLYNISSLKASSAGRSMP